MDESHQPTTEEIMERIDEVEQAAQRRHEEVMKQVKELTEQVRKSARDAADSRGMRHK